MTKPKFEEVRITVFVTTRDPHAVHEAIRKAAEPLSKKGTVNTWMQPAKK